MSLPRALLSTFLSDLRDIQSIRYAQLASGTIIMYDHLVTFGDEVELIWKSSWTLGKILFILNRYYPLIAAIVNTYAIFFPRLTNTFCLRYFQWQGWTGLLTCMFPEIILQMRIYALYSLNRKVLILIVAGFICASTASAVVMGKALSQITAIAAHPIPGLVSCVPAGVPKHFFAFWIPILVYESLLCGLALFRGFQTFQSSASPFRSGKYLVSILIRDSILYFLIMFATYLTNLLVWIVAPVNLTEIPVGFSVALSSIMGSRIIINMRAMNKGLSENRSLSRGALALGIHMDRNFTQQGETVPSEMEMTPCRQIRESW